MGKFALLIVLSLIIAFAVYNASINDRSMNTLLRNVETYNLNQAQNIAQSAANVLLSKVVDPDNTEFLVDKDKIKYFPENASDYFQWEDLNGQYRFQIENKGDSLLLLTSTGKVGDSSYSVMVTVDVEKETAPEFTYAAFADETIKLGGGFIKGDVATNSVAKDAVDISGGGIIDSVVYIGPGGDPGTVVKAETDAISGEIKNLSKPIYYPIPVFPDFPQSGDNQGTLQVDKKVVMQPVQFHNLYFEEIDIAKDDTLVLHIGAEDRTLHAETVSISGGKLTLIGTGSLTFYVYDEFKMTSGASFVIPDTQLESMVYVKGNKRVEMSGGSYMQSSIFSEAGEIRSGGGGAVDHPMGHLITGGSSVEVTGGGNVFYRVIYAPNAHVKFGGGTTASVAVVSRRLELSGGSNLTHPGSIEDFPDFTDPDDVVYTIKSWN